MKGTVVASCSNCGKDFTTWQQLPPCGKDCPFHRDFRIQESAISEAEMRLLGTLTVWDEQRTNNE